MFRNIFKIKNPYGVEYYMEKIKQDFKNDIGFRYPQENNLGSEYQYVDIITKKYLNKKVNYIAPELTFTRLRGWYLDNLYYQLIEKKDYIKALDFYTKSTWYGFFSLYVNHVSINCQFPYRVNYYSYSLISSYMAQCFLSGYFKEYKQIANWFYGSIKYKDISREAYVNNHETIYLDFETDRFDSVWFLYHIYCIVEENSVKIDSRNLVKPYKQVIDYWDTEDMIEVEKMVYLLSEYHLQKTKESTPNEQLYNEFNNPLYWLFPYEILVWLKLREQSGLKNPKTFTHPLMNTPIAKMFLNIKEPLPKPTELPYAKELLEKLKEQCPNVEIPEWLEGQTETKEPTTETPKGDDIIPDDFFLKG